MRRAFMMAFSVQEAILGVSYFSFSALYQFEKNTNSRE